jgi:hypothetical protein
MRKIGLWFRKCEDKTRKVSKMVANSEIMNVVIFLLIIKLIYTKIQKSKTESIIEELVSKIQQLTPMKDRSEENDDLRFSSHSQMIQNNRKIASLVPEYINSIIENQSTVIKDLNTQNQITEHLNSQIIALDSYSINETDINELSNQLANINEKYMTDLDQISTNLSQNSVTIGKLISQQDISKQKIGEFITYLNNKMGVIDDYIRIINRKIKEDY